MLVVDGVELVVLDQPQQVGKLQSQNTVGLQQNLQPFDEIVQVRNLRQHVVAEDQISAAAL